MSRPAHIPSYRLHKQSGQAIVTLTDNLGGRRDVLLGKYDTAESRSEYARVIGEWEARGRRLTADADHSGISVNEVLLAFLEHAERHYRHDDGTQTSEVREYKAAIRPARELYGTTEAALFGPLKLKAVRQRMVDAGLSRGVVNQRVGRIVRAFKWAVGEELVAESAWRALTAVRGLEKGRTDARETEPVKPVADAVVDATLSFLLPPVAAMVQLQRLTGMRPGELCSMRSCDLDTGGDVWLYRPERHKTKHRGKERVVALGPRAQEVVKPFLKLETTAFLFSPREALAQYRAELRRNRKTPVQPSQQNRRKRNPQRRPRDHYDSMSFAHAVAAGVRKANTAAACDECKPLKPDQRCDACKANAIPHVRPSAR